MHYINLIQSTYTARRLIDRGLEGTQMDVLEAGRLLTDGYALRILAAVSYKSKGAQEVSEEYNIPIAACYRRIKELEKAGLIVKSGRILNQKGKRVSIYSSMLKSAELSPKAFRISVPFRLASPT